MLGALLLVVALELVERELVQRDRVGLQPAPVDLLQLQPEVAKLGGQVPRVVVQGGLGLDSHVGVEHGGAYVLADTLDALVDGPVAVAVGADWTVRVVADVAGPPVWADDVHVQVLPGCMDSVELRVGGPAGQRVRCG